MLKAKKAAVLLLRMPRNAWNSRKLTAVGKGFNSHGRLVVTGKGKIFAGINLHIGNNVQLYAAKDAVIRFGNNVQIGANCGIGSVKSIEVGDFAIIAHSVQIVDTDFHGTDGNPCKEKPIKIGNRVWICSHVNILKGVSIGDNSIIGAGAVVTKEIPPYELWAGNPAKFIRKTTGYTL